MSGAHLTRREIDQQYRPRGYGLSPGLQRARKPYLLRNALTGVLIGSFAVGVWWYSIRAVKQDTFDDVDEEAKALFGARAGEVDAKARAMTTSTSGMAATASAPAATITSKSPAPVPAESVAAPTPPKRADIRGVLASSLVSHYPRAFDPTCKTLVWGAPPVDRIGRIGDGVDKWT